MPPIAVQVTQDGVDAKGHWTQTVRITIESGGSLSDASTVLYGDPSHVDELFALARKKIPSLASPAMIPAGLRLDVPIDPSKVYAVQSILTSSDSTVWRYTNGVVATAYTHPKGSLSRVIVFPDGKPTDQFSYPSAGGAVTVQPGGRIVDLIYATGEDFSGVVAQAIGVTNYNAAADFARQTGWSPQTWPPKVGTPKRLVVRPKAVYEQQPSAIQPIANPDPVGRARQAELLRQRVQAGIIPVRLESFGTVYHVAVSDPSLTAGGVAALLYGSPARAAEVAQAAGLGDGASIGSKPASFDPRLFGRAFDLSVDYVDEQFVLSRKVAEDGVTTIGLVDGAQITNYPTAKSGPLRVVRYPTGYKRIYYRPPKTLLDVANGLALFHLASASWLSPSDATAYSQQYAADIIWTWGPGIPRSAGDIPDSIQLNNIAGASYIAVLVAPGAPPTLLGNLLDSIVFRNPFVTAAALLVVCCGILVLIGLARRAAVGLSRPEW